MSISLLESLRGHLNPTGGRNLLDGYAVRFYRWSDTDLKQGQIILFRMKGTHGPSAHVIQRPDVSIQMLCDPMQVRAGDCRMLEILQYLRANFEIEVEQQDDDLKPATNVFNLLPIGTYCGPTYLQNNRANFEMVVRTMVVNH